MIEAVRAGIKNGLMFPEFNTLYDKMIEVFFLVAEMEFLLIYAGEVPPPEGPQFLFNSQDLEFVFGVLNTLRNMNLKDLQTKEGGDQVLSQVRLPGFPRGLVSYKMFEDFMGRAEAWSQRAIAIINTFKHEAGEVNIR